MATHSVFLPGEFHGQRSLAGYTVHGVAESDVIERLSNPVSSLMHTFPCLPLLPGGFISHLPCQ